MSCGPATARNALIDSILTFASASLAVFISTGTDAFISRCSQLRISSTFAFGSASGSLLQNRLVNVGRREVDTSSPVPPFAPRRRSKPRSATSISTDETSPNVPIAFNAAMRTDSSVLFAAVRTAGIATLSPQSARAEINCTCCAAPRFGISPAAAFITSVFRHVFQRRYRRCLNLLIA